jgi:hypothetical protein
MARPKQTEHRRGFLIKLLSQEKETIRQQAHLAGLTVSVSGVNYSSLSTTTIIPDSCWNFFLSSLC